MRFREDSEGVSVPRCLLQELPCRGGGGRGIGHERYVRECGCRRPLPRPRLYKQTPRVTARMLQEGEGGLRCYCSQAIHWQKRLLQKLCCTAHAQVEESQPYVVQYGQERLPKYMQVCSRMAAGERRVMCAPHAPVACGPTCNSCICRVRLGHQQVMSPSPLVKALLPLV